MLLRMPVEPSSARLDGSSTAEAAAEIHVDLMGRFSVTIDDRRIPDDAWRLRRARDIVKLLALARNHELHREQVMEALWPEREPESAANNLHQALHVARRAVEDPAMLQLRDGVVRLFPGGAVEVDVEEYEDAVGRARGSGTLEDLLIARAAYRGELLPDDRFEPWTEVRRSALLQEHLELLWGLASAQEAAGDRPGAIASLREIIDADPVHEAAHASLMRLYALEGQPRLAIRQYGALRSWLRRELDVEPGEETEALRREILAGHVTADSTRRTAPEESPPLHLTASRPRASHNLPLQLSSFIGRDAERADVARALTTSRAVTLTGVGGCGKTRLAVEVATGALSRFDEGARFVPLASVGLPSLVVPSIAEAFEVREEPGVELIESLAMQIGDAQVLLILDNCEHVVAA
jgi:DNA-binding SARP family transcriptional activator